MAMDTFYDDSFYLQGLMTVPNEQYEAAKIDGANWYHVMTKIEIPSILGFMLLGIVFVLISIRLFDIIYVTTRGGPGIVTEVMAYFTYRTEFRSFQIGTGSASAVIILIISIIVTTIAVTLLRRVERDADFLVRKNIILLAFAIFFMLIFILPNLWMLFGSFKDQNAMFSLPPVWIPDFTYIKNFTIYAFAELYVFIKLFNSYYWLNNRYINIFSTYGIWFDFLYSEGKFLADWILSTRMLPPVAAAVPLFILFKYLNLLDSLFALIIVYTAFNIPFAVWVSASLEESQKT